MAMNWFCQVTAGGKGFIRNRAQERRYREALFRMAQKEMAEIPEYTCREGKIFIIISCNDEEIVRKIVKSANASYGKYLKLLGKTVNFDNIETKKIQKIHEYETFRQQFFYTFYVAENRL